MDPLRHTIAGVGFHGIILISVVLHERRIMITKYLPAGKCESCKNTQGPLRAGKKTDKGNQPRLYCIPCHIDGNAD